MIDLRDRLEALPPPAPEGGAALSPPPPPDAAAEAVNALVALGLKPAEASRRVHAVHAEGAGTEEIVRRALQSMVK